MTGPDVGPCRRLHKCTALICRCRHEQEQDSLRRDGSARRSVMDQADPGGRAHLRVAGSYKFICCVQLHCLLKHVVIVCVASICR